MGGSYFPSVCALSTLLRGLSLMGATNSSRHVIRLIAFKSTAAKVLVQDGKRLLERADRKQHSSSTVVAAATDYCTPYRA